MSDFKIDNPDVLFLSGGTMRGAIIQPIAPINQLELVNKDYVDSLVSTGVPDATTVLKGKIQLAGDLGGVGTAAAAPIISNGAITNAKLANLTNVSQLKGSNSISSAATDISLGVGLNMIGSTLNVNTVLLPFLPLAGGTMSGSILQPVAPVNPNDLANKTYVDAQISSVTTPDATTLIKGKVQLAGDLTGTAANPTVADLAITPNKIVDGAISNIKLANLSGPSHLKGSSSFTSAATDIALGTYLTITGFTLDVNLPSLSGSFLPLSGGTMSGAISQPLAPVNPNDLTNKLYVDSFFVPDATTLVKGKVQLAGDLTGTASSPTVANLAITTPKINNLAVTNAKLANLGGTSQLKGSSSGSPSATDLTLGSNLSITGTVLDVNTSSLSGSFLPLAGGTMSGAISQPVAPVNPNDLTNKAYVDAQIATGVPDATTLIKGKVQLAGDLGGVGTTAAAPIISNLAVTNAKLANLGGTSQLKGSSSSSPSATDLTLGSNLSITGTVLDVNTSSLSGSFLPLAGGTMSGAISQPVAPVNPNDLTNKAYVDAQISSVTVPDATTLIKGKVQLAGDLGGVGTTAAAPIISNLAVTNAKLNNGPVSTLKGTSSGGTVSDITLGAGLNLSGTTLTVDSTIRQKAGNTQFGVVQFNAIGDLTQTSANSGIATVKNVAITNPKINPGASSTIKGTNSLSNVADFNLDSSLLLTAGISPTLSVNTVNLQKAGNTQFGVVQFNAIGDLTQTAANSGIGVVKNNAITNAKLANLSGTSQLKGSSSLSTAATDLTLGTGLTISGTVLSTAPITKNQNVVRALTTSTGAAGFQVSSTLPSRVYYSVAISTTIAVGGSSTGTVFLEVAPTNSAVAGNWVVDAQVSNNQSFAGLLTLSSTQNITFELSTFVPAGFFVKLRTTTAGTASFTYLRGTEVIG